MSRHILGTALAVVLLTTAAPVLGQEKKADALVALLDKLRQPVDFGKGAGEMGLRDYTTMVAEKIGVPIVIGPEAVNGDGMADPNEAKVRPISGKIAAGKALAMVLAQQGQTFLVRKDYLLVTSLDAAVRDTKAPVDEDNNRRLTVPLVSAVFKEKPLNEAVAELAEDYDATVIVAPQVGDAKAAFVSARMLNVPLNKALELLALQADLRVLTRGNAFVITTADVVNNEFNEALERQKQQVEIERLRITPIPPPAPPPLPADNK